MPRATFANVTSVLALVVALGGTGYAATALPRNSVGSLQLKADAVTSAKVKDRSLLAKDFASGQLPRGATGPAGPLLTKLPSGRTVRGDFYLAGDSTAGGQLVGGSVSWGLEVGPGLQTRVVQAGGAATAECAGTFAQPEAAAGYACFYVRDAIAVGALGTFGTETDDQDTYRFGTALYAFSSAAGDTQIFGAWAVTAP